MKHNDREAICPRNGHRSKLCSCPAHELRDNKAEKKVRRPDPWLEMVLVVREEKAARAPGPVQTGLGDERKHAVLRWLGPRPLRELIDPSTDLLSLP